MQGGACGGGAACAVHGADMAVFGGDCNSAVGGHERALSEQALGAVGLSSRYCSTGPGPIRCTVLFFQLFKLCSNFKIQNEDHPYVKKY
jgi:hypothetical protein